MKNGFMILVILLAGILVFPDQRIAADDSADRQSIEKVVDSYVNSWLKGDAAGVMDSFDRNAVLLPHHGLEPVVGQDAIQKFWWPVDGPPTSIDRFTVILDEIGIEKNLAYARGKFSLQWTSQEKTFENAGNQLMIFKKQKTGDWKISHQIWNDPPNREITKK